jgi:hypothetical protein
MGILHAASVTLDRAIGGGSSVGLESSPLPKSGSDSESDSESARGP